MARVHPKDCGLVENLFEIFHETGWIYNHTQFKNEKDGFYAFKTGKLRIYGIVFKLDDGNVFVITEIFLKQGKPKEHNRAVETSLERMRTYESDLRKIRSYQKKDQQINPKDN